MGLTTFQIISLIFSAILLLSSIVGVYIKLKIDITKLDVKVAEITKDLEIRAAELKTSVEKTAIELKVEVERTAAELAKDLVQWHTAILLNEKNNRDDHKEILVKVDKIIDSMK